MLCIILFYFYSTYELSCLRRCSQCNLIRATSPSPHQKRKVFRERVEVIELPAMIRVRVKAKNSSILLKILLKILAPHFPTASDIQDINFKFNFKCMSNVPAQYALWSRSICFMVLGLHISGFSVFSKCA